MKTKLTLSIEKDLVESAKRQSSLTGKSISRLVEEYFDLLQARDSMARPEPPHLTPTVRSLKGILKGEKVTEEDYRKALEEKYL